MAEVDISELIAKGVPSGNDGGSDAVEEEGKK